MGLKPSDYAMLAGAIGGPLLGSLFAPEGQERQSFEDNPNTSPSSLMESNKNILDSMFGTLMTRANAGVSLPSAVVQQPGAYTGGGLPMPIGLVASDPALSNRNLLRIPGLSGVDVDPTPRTKMGPDGKAAPPRDPSDGDWRGPDESGPYDSDDSGTRVIGPRPGSSSGFGARRRSSIGEQDGEYGQLVRASDLMGGGDDLSQATGSVALLLEALGYPQANA